MEADEQQPGAPNVREKVAVILAAFHGKTVPITEAGKENMRTVNRLARLVTMRVIATDKTFRHNIARYHVNELDEDIVIGARRERNGIWSLVAELTPRS